MPLALVLLLLLAGGAAAFAADEEAESLPSITATLKTGTAAERREAIDKLDAFADEAQAVLYQALADADLEVRLRAVMSIGRHHLLDATPRLIALLGDAEPRLRAASAEALGVLGGSPRAAEAVEPALKRALLDSDHEVRQAAIQALERVPIAIRRQAVLALAARLDDESAAVRERAAQALGALGDPRAVMPLIGRLADASREVRLEAASALGELGDERAAPALIRLLGDPADEVRAETILALGQLKAPAAIPALLALFERGAGGLRGRAGLALGAIAGRARAADAERVVQALVGALARPELRQAAREAIVRLGAPAVPALIGQLESPLSTDPALVVELLGWLGDPRATRPLIGELGRGRVRRPRITWALARLARAGDASAMLPLVALLGDSALEVKRRAAEGLRGLADGRAIPAWLSLLKDADRDLRLIAAGELGRLGAKRAVPELILVLRSTDVELGQTATRALAALGDVRAQGPLLEALERPDAQMRRAAADALARLGDAQTTDALMHRMVRLPADRRAESILAFGMLRRGRPQPLARELLLGYAERGEEGSLEAIRALGTIGDGAAAPRLIRLLEGTHGREAAVRLCVAQALGQLGGSKAESALVLLAADSHPEVQAEAVWALGKLPGSTASKRAVARALASASAAVRSSAAGALYRLRAGAGAGAPELERLLGDVDAAARANAALALGADGQALEAIGKLAALDPDPRVRAAAHLARQGKAPLRGDGLLPIRIADFDAGALADAAYLVVLPDGLLKHGRAGASGLALEESLPPGPCRVEIY